MARSLGWGLGVERGGGTGAACSRGRASGAGVQGSGQRAEAVDSGRCCVVLQEVVLVLALALAVLSAVLSVFAVRPSFVTMDAPANGRATPP